ncbi:MAG: lactate utilization protein C [Burkholderiales bacterium]|jgi:L-lactate dehydrogenase complex protein LldG|nr:lactate utilization protein C [Burkholderiales bacterium]
MSARANILSRIRTRQGKAVTVRASEREAVAQYLAAHPQGPRPQTGNDAVARFRERALGLSTTIGELSSAGEIPAAVARYLQSAGLAPAAVCWPQFAALDWRAQGIAVEARAAHGDDLVGITGAFCAIAETGTLMMCSGPDTPPATSLLPETHIAVLRRDRIVAGMEDAWALLRSESAGLPRAVNFISGPSRTADIEQTVTLGAHGPYRVHILLL